ncbi:MAG: hypothetical protein GSR86_01425 [Desulfurococcales archaeon]|nr:hypothetical protein [Desulfurococcales archaeon]
MYRKIESETGIPTTTISRYIEKLGNMKVSFRADYNIKDLDLKMLIFKILNKNIQRHDIQKFPLSHWLAAVINLEKSLLIIYRVPKNINEDYIIQNIIKELDIININNIDYIIKLTDTMLAKPSFEFYLENTPIDPIKALDINEYHPLKSNFIDYNYLIRSNPRYGLKIVRDKIDLYALSIAEMNVLDLEEKLKQYFIHKRATKKIYKNINMHINHILKMIHGSRLIHRNKDGLKFIIIGNGKPSCINKTIQYLLTYFYAYSIAVDPNTGNFSVSLDLPVTSGYSTNNYINTITDRIRSICGYIIDVIKYDYNNVVEYYTIPFRNYDFIRKKWILDNEVLKVHDEKLKKNGFILYL